MSNKYNLKKIKESFKVYIGFTESNDVCSVEGFHTSEAVESLEEFLKLCSDRQFTKLGYHKTDFELYLLGSKFYSGRLDIGDSDYSHSGLYQHIKRMVPLYDKSDDEKKKIQEMFDFLFSYTDELSNTVIESFFDEEELKLLRVC
ncbi:MAG: hypothetical protein N4A40_13040 [Tissierellales bacterium]|nr:hypothetical protein [Tissierellales bacterium]